LKMLGRPLARLGGSGSRGRSLIPALLVALAHSTMIACAEQPTSRRGNRAPDEYPQRLQLTEEARIDGNAADLVRVGGIVAAGPTMIALSQPQDRQLRFYSLERTEVARFGGAGQGPGEFSALGRIGVIGDSIWASDPGLARMTVLKPDFELGRTARIPGRAIPPPGDTLDLPEFSFVFV
jgi:hypothetical protein